MEELSRFLSPSLSCSQQPGASQYRTNSCYFPLLSFPLFHRPLLSVCCWCSCISCCTFCGWYSSSSSSLALVSFLKSSSKIRALLNVHKSHARKGVHARGKGVRLSARVYVVCGVWCGVRVQVLRVHACSLHRVRMCSRLCVSRACACWYPSHHHSHYPYSSPSTCECPSHCLECLKKTSCLLCAHCSLCLFPSLKFSYLCGISHDHTNCISDTHTQWLQLSPKSMFALSAERM